MIVTNIPRAAPPRSPVPRLFGADSDDILDAITHAGCAVVEQAAPKSSIERVCSELTPWFDRTPNGEGAFFGQATKRMGAIFAKSPAAAQLATSPEILGAIERKLLSHAPSLDGASDCIQIHLTQAIQIESGEPAQILHRDDAMFPFNKPHEVMINVMWPLDAFTELNGATRLAPFSQNWPRQSVIFSDEGVYDVAAEPGAAIVWLGSLVHGGGANRSNAPRRGLVISYSLAWLAQAEKLLLSIPPHVVRTLPVRLQRLLGYQVHRPNLGWIEGRDPMEWLDGKTGPVAAATDNLTPEQQRMLDALKAAETV